MEIKKQEQDGEKNREPEKRKNTKSARTKRRTDGGRSKSMRRKEGEIQKTT
jgi:hypothetical protein